MLTALAIILLLFILPMYALYILYAAVMNFKRARDLGVLSKTGLVLGYLPYIVGSALDVYCNLIPVSVILLEFPKLLGGELTVTARMTRLRKTGGRRGDTARWFCGELLNALDPSGDHCQ